MDEKELLEKQREQRKRLESLREMTTLNPFDYFRVKNARWQAERFRDIYISENQSDIIETDYSVADDLEYFLRFRQWERDVKSAWLKYLGLENDRYGLSEFAEDSLLKHMNEKGQSGRRRM